MLIPTEVEAKADVQAKIERVKGGAELLSWGRKFTSQHSQLSGIYRVVCKIIRKNQIKPSEVRVILTAAGWSKERISEVIRVSCVSDALWREFERNFMGFKLMLRKAREESGVKLSVGSAWVRVKAAWYRIVKRGGFQNAVYVEGGAALINVQHIPEDEGEKLEFFDGPWRVVLERVGGQPKKKKK